MCSVILCVFLTTDTLTKYCALTLLSKKKEAVCSSLAVRVWIRLNEAGFLSPVMSREAEGSLLGFTEI